MSKIFIQLCRQAGLPEPQPEHRFDPIRRWRIDWFFERDGLKVGLEVEGGVYTRGRHLTPSGFLKDIEKYNAMSLAGIFLLRTTPDKLSSMNTVNMLREMFQNSNSL